MRPCCVFYLAQLRWVLLGFSQFEKTVDSIVKQALQKSSSCPLPWFLAGAVTFLYLNLFILPNTPIWLGGDNSVYLLDATRMFDGQVIYRDFFHFVPPGTELVYIVFFKLFGIHAFVPNLSLIVVGTALTWVVTNIARKVVSGTTAFLPGLVFLTFAFRRAFDGYHHWLSLLAVMAAILLVIEKRTYARLAIFGALCGIASCFTQTHGLVAILGLALFLLWEKRTRGQPWGILMKLEVCMAAPFLAIMAVAVAYFSREVGLARYIDCTVIFLIRFYPKDLRWNTFRVYMTEPPEFLPLSRLPTLGVYLFIHTLLPLVYVIFFIRYLRFERIRPQEPWDRLMLLNFMGLALFVGVAPAPDWVRLCSASLPGLILLAWLLNEPGKFRQLLARSLWFVALVLALAEPIERQTHWHAYLDLPLGRAALLTPAEHDKFEWLLHRTRPSEFLLEAGFPDVYFLLGLRNPAEVAFLTPTDYTRPEQVHQAIEALEKYQVRFVIWRVELDLPFENRTAGDHLSPIRDYIHQRYRVDKTFSTEQIWERIK